MNFKEKLTGIKAFAFDVDGVFTDGQVYLMAGNEFVRAMNIKDGYAVQHCVKMGYPVAIISGGSSEEVRKRFIALGVTDIYLKSANKLDDFEDFKFKYHLDESEILYMGDDIPDIPVMQSVGIATCPEDAVQEVKHISEYVSASRGGQGCVRDIIEQVLRVQNKWLNDKAFIW
ncbi:MAG TPA: 3-deoxy-D-manno-octulosonate 8-phosphate phosphatase [Bacteroidales bacterium]|jgi:3-deoxy-D-manno-octulosonate 8-phosphate phosphatase (KDO 8-P phosphatase)|nr:3-deoxy-D-manno-octulosonate 8-phosphate phosphatase [Bacteroidales bacterium]